MSVCTTTSVRDGSGYPDALKGDKTGLLAKMCAVCDVYDAISSDRPYQKGLGPGRVDPQDGRVEQTAV